MISNLQLNCPQVCLNIGNQSILGVVSEVKLDGDGHKITAQNSLEQTEFFVLLKSGDSKAKVIKIKVDTFGLNNTEFQNDWTTDPK
jgi:hypothetical protein